MPVLPAAVQRGGRGTGSENLLAGAVTHHTEAHDIMQALDKTRDSMVMTAWPADEQKKAK
jgi:hypothetical protein